MFDLILSYDVRVDNTMILDLKFKRFTPIQTVGRLKFYLKNLFSEMLLNVL